MELRVLQPIGSILVSAALMMLVGFSQGAMKNAGKVSSKPRQESDFDPTERTFPETLALDSKMSAFLRDNHYTGATLGVARGDQVRYTQGYGQTDEGAPMRPTTLLPISSLSKTITAVAVLKMVEAGDLELTDQVFGSDGILSSFRPSDKMGMDPRLLDITVEHLLHHTAGWSQSTPRLYDPMMNSVYLSRGHDVIDIAKEMRLEHDLSPDDVITYMMMQPLDNPPGIQYQYSNFGYCVLGRVIEHISGKSYASFIRSQILEPLGMWHTRISPKSSSQSRHNNHIPVLHFFEGGIPLSDVRPDVTAKSYKLLDSTLGWWSTVYDLMRFVTGLTSGMLLNPKTLELLTKHPEAPVSEHRDTWHGLGVQANEDATWWQIGDPHDDEIILFHQQSLTPPKSRQSRFRKPPAESWSWLVILSDNNRKNLRQTFTQILSSVTQWPADNLLIEDCSENPIRGSQKHSTLMNSHVGEGHFPLFLNAVSRLSFYPVWISAYNINQKTYLATILKRDTENSYQVSNSVTKSELINLRTDNLLDSMYLNFVTSYNSHNSDGGIRYSAIFSQTPSRNTKFGIGESLDDFSASLDEVAGKHMPTTQSVASLDGVGHFTYSLSDHKVYSWKSFPNLTLDQLELQIRMNAKTDQVLSYLDSYTHHGDVLFSAVFGPARAGKWQVQTEVRQNELSDQIATLQGLHFRPRLVVGYECKGHPCFVIMWKKH
ncbi:uncharacterized protein LOC119723670 [Patiria miniata]|uniref:Beta-lactamase-related domain-containing protein n=1 Tax=Patiria miniata TaxID=46514 RepID=A0A913ZF21_PATMI|nr:uncharacterized protein LOC119723670 [Patiria miniata]